MFQKHFNSKIIIIIYSSKSLTKWHSRKMNHLSLCFKGSLPHRWKEVNAVLLLFSNHTEIPRAQLLCSNLEDYFTQRGCWIYVNGNGFIFSQICKYVPIKSIENKGKYSEEKINHVCLLNLILMFIYLLFSVSPFPLSFLPFCLISQILCGVKKNDITQLWPALCM